MKKQNWILSLAVLLAALAFAARPAVIFAGGADSKSASQVASPHTVVSEDKTFKSNVLDTDEQFSYTFTKPGTYNYFCSIHPKMTAQVVVH